MATIYDIAQAVGVSHTTVSTVLNDKPGRVGDSTRQRIMEAAERLGYRTNRAAQQLATGKFNTIAICFERASKGLLLNPVANQIIAGVGDSAQDNELFLLFAPAAPEGKFEQTVDSLSTHAVDGAVIVGPVPSMRSAILAIDRCNIPLVCIDSYPGYVAASTVDQDNLAGMRIGVEHLIEKGHTRLAYIAPAPVYQCLVDRMSGFCEAVQGSGLAIEDQSIHTVGVDGVSEVVRKLAEMPGGPTAIVSAEEYNTTAILGELADMGLRVPEDISVLSYGEPYLPHQFLESIDIIHCSRFGMGRAAGDLLKKIIDGECPQPLSLRLLPECLMHR